MNTDQIVEKISLLDGLLQKAGRDPKAFDPRKIWNEIRKLQVELNKISADLQAKSEAIDIVESDVEILDMTIRLVAGSVTLVYEAMIGTGLLPMKENPVEPQEHFITISYVHMDDKSRPTFGVVNLKTSALYELGERLLVQAIACAGFQPSDFANPGNNQNTFRILFSGIRPEWANEPVLSTDDQRFQDWLKAQDSE